MRETASDLANFLWWDLWHVTTIAKQLIACNRVNREMFDVCEAVVINALQWQRQLKEVFPEIDTGDRRRND